MGVVGALVVHGSRTRKRKRKLAKAAVGKRIDAFSLHRCLSIEDRTELCDTTASGRFRRVVDLFSTFAIVARILAVQGQAKQIPQALSAGVKGHWCRFPHPQRFYWFPFGNVGPFLSASQRGWICENTKPRNFVATAADSPSSPTRQRPLEIPVATRATVTFIERTSDSTEFNTESIEIPAIAQRWPRSRESCSSS